MAIKPPAPLPTSYIDYDYRWGDRETNPDNPFLPPTHLGVISAPRGIDQGLDSEVVDIDTSFDRADILAREPIPRVRPLFLGIRKSLAASAIERSNNQLRGYARQHRVARHIGHSILAGASYMGKNNVNRPASRQELNLARKLGKIDTRRRRAGDQLWAGNRSTTPPVEASRQEKRDAKKNAKRQHHGEGRIDMLHDRFKTTIAEPVEKAKRASVKRDKAVARHEALQQAIERRDGRRERRQEKVRQLQDELKGSAQALGDEIIERHYESWDLTKEQAERLAKASARAGKVVLDQTVATAQFTGKGSKYTARFYAEVAKGAADIYWQAAKRAGLGVAKGVRKLYGTVKSKK